MSNAATFLPAIPHVRSHLVPSLHFVRDAAQGSLATCHDLLQHRGGELSELDALLLQVVHLRAVPSNRLDESFQAAN